MLPQQEMWATILISQMGEAAINFTEPTRESVEKLSATATATATSAFTEVKKRRVSA